MTKPIRVLLAFTTLAGGTAFALPVAAQTVAGPGAEFTIAPEMPVPAAGAPCLIGSDGMNFAVFQGCAQPLTAQRVSPGGSLLDPVAVGVPFADSDPLAVAQGAGGYMLLWNSTKFSFPLMSHLDAKLASVESQPDLWEERIQFNVAVARGDDGGYLLVGDSNGSLLGLLLDSSGQPVGSSFTIGFDTGYHSVTFGGGNYEVVWAQGSGANVFASRVSKQGVVLDTTPVTVTTTSSGATPLVAAGASHFVVTWSDARADAGLTSVYGARLGFDGTLLDAAGIDLVPGGSLLGATYASSTGFAVAWSVGASSYVANLSEANMTLTPSAGTALDAPMLASNGAQALVEWSSNGQPVASPLGAAGAPVLNPPAKLGLVTVPNGVATLASSGSGFLAMWSSVPPAGAPSTSNTYWVRPLDADGAPLAQPTQLPPLAAPGFPTLVWTGSMYAVVTYAAGTGGASVVRIKPDGTLIDTAPVPFLDLSSDAAPPPAAVSFYGGGGALRLLTSGDAIALRTCDETLACTPTPVTVTVDGTVTGVSAGAVDATHIEVAWTDAKGLYASLVDTKAMTAGAPVALDATTGITLPMVTRGSQETAVGATRPEDGSIAIYRLDATGALLDGPHSTQSPVGISGASLIWDGASYVLAWAQSSGNGVMAYASNLGALGSSFGLGAPVPVFTEAIGGAPAIARMGDGGALRVAAQGSGASVLGVPWTIATDAGTPEDGGSIDDASSGADATVDAGGSAPSGDGGGASNGDGGASEAGAVGSGSPGGSSGCSCRAAAPSSDVSPIAALGIVAGLALGLRRRRRLPRRGGVAAIALVSALTLSVHAAHASPSLTPGAPTDLDSPLPVFTGVAFGEPPQLKTDGTNFLLVYMDDNAAMRALRIGPDGVPLDGASFAAPCGGPIASVSGGYLLGCGANPPVLMAPDGTVKGSGDKPAASIGVLASSPTGFLALEGNGSGVLLDANGKVASGTFTVPVSASSYSLTAAWANGTWLVLWGQGEDLWTLTVSPSGIAGTPSVLLPSVFNPNTFGLALAGGDTGFLAAWSDLSDGVSAALISTAGALSGSGVITVRDGFAFRTPSVAFRAGNYTIAWTDDGPRPGVYAATVNESTGAATPKGGTYVGDYGMPVVAANASATYCVVLPAELNGSSPPETLYGERLDTTGAPLAPKLGTPGQIVTESQASIAGSSAGFLAAWSESPGGGVWIEEVSTAGKKLWDAVRLYPTAKQGANGYAPHSTWTGSGWLVTWQYDDPFTSATTSYGARVSVDGTVLDAAPIALTSGTASGVSAAAVTDANGYVLLVRDDSGGVEYSIVNASTGTVAPLGASLAHAPGPDVFLGVAAATDGTKFAIVYSSAAELYATIVDPTSTAAPTVTPLAMGGPFSAVSMAWSAAGYVVEALTSTGLAGFTFDATGGNLKTLPVIGSVSAAPTLVQDGVSLVLAWNGASATYAAMLDANGALGVPVSVLGQSVGAGAPSLATAGGGESMVAASVASLTRVAAVVVPVRDGEPVDAGEPGDGGVAGDGGGAGDGGLIGDASSGGGDAGEVAPPETDGSTGDAGGAPPATSKGGGGCSCRVEPDAGGSVGLWAGLLVLCGVVAGRARRRARVRQ